MNAPETYIDSTFCKVTFSVARAAVQTVLMAEAA